VNIKKFRLTVVHPLLCGLQNTAPIHTEENQAHCVKTLLPDGCVSSITQAVPIN
jgi:hypothetical protein